jgi:integrase
MPGLRSNEALALNEADLDHRRGSLRVLQGVDNGETISTVRARRAPMLPVSTHLGHPP